MPKQKLSDKRKREIRDGPANARYGPPTIKMPADAKNLQKMTIKKIQLLAAAGVGTSFAATEAAAWLFHFSPRLADSEWTKGVYYPWAIYVWLWNSVVNHASINTQLASMWLFVIISCVITFAFYKDGIRKAYIKLGRHTDEMGSARWADPKEVEHTGLLRTDPQAAGIYVGEWSDPFTEKREWLRDTRDRHVMLLAPTRSGKGVSIIIPTILTWTGSMVVNDPKGENYEICARARIEMGQYALKHDPACTDGTGAKFNPLDEIRKGTVYDLRDAMQLAMFLVDPLGQGMDTGGDNDHWRKVAWSFLTGAILHIVYSPHHHEKTLHALDAFIDSGSLSQDQVLDEMYTTEHDPEYKYGWLDANNQRVCTHPTVAASARAMKERPPNERGSAMSSAKGYTQLYKDEILAENTSRSDFSIDDIMHNPKGVSLFLVNTPEDMVRIRGHMRMIINLINSRFTGKDAIGYNWEVSDKDKGKKGAKAEFKQVKNIAKTLLFCQDEFTSTHGKLDTFANSLAFHAGYGIRCLIVAQDYSQLEGTYGESGAQAIMSNMHTNIYYATTNDKTASRIQQMLGTMTYMKKEKSYGSKGGAKTIFAPHSRPLIYADEFMQLPEDDGVAIIAGTPPIYVQKIRYYNEPAFTRLIAKPPEASQIIPHDDRAINVKLATLQKQNAKRIADRKLRANGYAPKNESLLDDKDEAGVQSDTAPMGPYDGPAPFDDESPIGSFGPQPTPPKPFVPKDRMDRGLDHLFDDGEEDAA